MALSEDDFERVLRHFHHLTSSQQFEIASSLADFTGWLSTIAALANLVKFAATIWKWIRRQM
jgi:hypothetical protein